MIRLYLIFPTLFAFSAQAADWSFERDVLPALEKNCLSCHGPEKQKGKVRLDTLSRDLATDSAAAETWHDALNALQLGEMPPDDEPQPNDTELRAMTGWIQAELDRAIASKRSTGGRVVIRRLNRVEYQNTMSDLLGLDIDYAKNLPPDPLGPDGFQNNGASLGMSGMQLEQYLATARDALSRAIVFDPEPKVHTHAATETVQDKTKDNYTNHLARTGIFVARIPEFPKMGEFELKIRARAKLPTPDSAFPRMKIDLGYLTDTQRPRRELAQADVTSEETQEFVFRGRVDEFPQQSRTQSKYPGQLIWIRNLYDDGEEFNEARTREIPQKNKDNVKNKKKKPKKEKIWTADPNFPAVVIESIEFIAPIFVSWPPEHHRRILPMRESSEGELIYARRVLESFLARAFRRPVKDGEVKHLLQFFTKARPQFGTLEETLRETLAMALISPEFLYLVEPDSSNEKRRLDEFELASRLSYFMWSSMPDDRLFQLAKSGKLSEAKILGNEVERMLADSNARQFVEQFTGQWLDLAQVDRVAVNPEYYPDFDNALKPWMQAETRAFFTEILTNDLSALEFLDADFAMLNEPLAKHYGLPGPRSREFVRVDLPADSRRGGLLTQASMLLGNSTGEDSHPIKRAVWIRERLLHDPPAPPPPNVPELDAENPNFAKLPVRAQLEAHRNDAACADCHRGIDPWGVAMEEFDAIGLFREEIRRKAGKNRFNTVPVIARETLPDGTEVNGSEELKAFLLSERRDQFAHALVTKMLSYGLGRSLELTDEPQIREIAEEFAVQDYRLRTLIKLIVTSEAFATK